MYDCDRQTTDIQTDHVTEKCVAIVGIACSGNYSASKCVRLQVYLPEVLHDTGAIVSKRFTKQYYLTLQILFHRISARTHVPTLCLKKCPTL